MRDPWLVVLLCICAPATVAAAPKQKLAVLELEQKGVDASAAQNVTELVGVALKKLEVFDVITRADIAQLMSFEQDKQLVGCGIGTSCIAELGGALGVATLVSGSVGKLGSNYVLTLVLMDTKAAKVLERETRTAASLELLGKEVDSAARALVRILLAGKLGELVVRGAESGAEVELDGKLIGITPLPRLKLPSGPHQIRVTKKGFVALAADVTIKASDTLVFEATLMPSLEFIADYDRKANGLRWGAIGGIAGGAALFAGGMIVYFGVADPTNNRHNARRAEILAGTRTADGDLRYNDEAVAIQGLYRAGQALSISGAIVAAAGVVLFFAAPTPGVYDQFKSIEVKGGPKVSFDVSPIAGGLYGQARVTF